MTQMHQDVWYEISGAGAAKQLVAATRMHDGTLVRAAVPLRPIADRVAERLSGGDAEVGAAARYVCGVADAAEGEVGLGIFKRISRAVKKTVRKVKKTVKKIGRKLAKRKLIGKVMRLAGRAGKLAIKAGKFIKNKVLYSPYFQGALAAVVPGGAAAAMAIRAAQTLEQIARRIAKGKAPKLSAMVDLGRAALRTRMAAAAGKTKAAKLAARAFEVAQQQAKRLGVAPTEAKRFMQSVLNKAKSRVAVRAKTVLRKAKRRVQRKRARKGLRALRALRSLRALRARRKLQRKARRKPQRKARRTRALLPPKRLRKLRAQAKRKGKRVYVVHSPGGRVYPVAV